MRREMVKFLRDLEEKGFQVQQSKGGHFKLTHPNITGPIFTSSTPSDHRSFKNIQSVIKRKLAEGKQACQKDSRSSVGYVPQMAQQYAG